MKVSSIVILFILLAIGIISYFVYQSSQKTVWNLHPNGVFEDRGDFKTFEQDKADDRNNILLIGFGIMIVLFIIYYTVTKQENKTDPVKNLENLKNNSIITSEEYSIKINKAIYLNQLENLEKEKKKIVDELENLKTKGIIDETEYLEKIELINTKYSI